MASLVNPYGWRLYFNRYWKTTFYINNKLFSITNLKSKVLKTYLNNIFSKLTLTLGRKKLMEFLGFKTILFHDNVYIIVKLRFYWSMFHRDLSIGHNRMLRSLRQFDDGKTFYLPPRKKRTTHHNKNTPAPPPVQQVPTTVEKSFSIWKKKNYFICNNFSPKYSIMPNYPKLMTKKNYYTLIKALFYYFCFTPVFDFYKKIILKTLKLKFFTSQSLKANVFFTAVSWRHTSAKMLLNYVNVMLTKKAFSPTKTLYTSLNILKKWQKKTKLKGFKFLLAGRFTRRDRATYMWKKFDSVPLGTKPANIEFETLNIQLKYSRCVAKVWLCHA